MRGEVKGPTHPLSRLDEGTEGGDKATSTIIVEQDCHQPSSEIREPGVCCVGGVCVGGSVSGCVWVWWVKEREEIIIGRQWERVVWVVWVV